MEKLRPGDRVDTGGPRGSWYKYGTVIEVDERRKMAKVRFPNGRIDSYGFRQLRKFDWQ